MGRVILVLMFAAFTAPLLVARDPDLVVDSSQLAGYWYIEERYFPPDDCALVEECVDAPGVRKLLRFRTTTANIGRVDLEMGDPTTNPLFVFSPCHGHYHFDQYADYRLKDLSGTVVAPGHKQSFCLEDSFQYLPQPWVEPTRRYDCSFQGIQAGWADVYGASLDCQWIDVTGVPNGSYTLEVEVNPAHLLLEEDYTNNTASVQVDVTDVVGISHRPDGWIVPGAPLQVGREGVMERIYYDAVTCPAEDYNLLYSFGSPGDYVFDGAVCGLGASGDVAAVLPDPLPGELLWFTVAGVDSSVYPQAEGGHGFDSQGRPRPLSGAGFCGISETLARTFCSD